MIKDISIRAFRATDDPLTCEKFVFEHRRVLESYGIKQVSSSNNEWMKNPTSFVIVVETLDGKKLLGGGRVQVADGEVLLPIELATVRMDSRIRDIIKKEAINGTGELCGLWNSKEVAGLGIGCQFAGRAALAICKQIGLTTLFLLCAPTTVKLSKAMGGKTLTSIGNNGTFYYPKIDLLATTIYFRDVISFEDASPIEKQEILQLIENPIQTVEKRAFKQDRIITIHYNLSLQNIDHNEFRKPYDLIAV